MAGSQRLSAQQNLFNIPAGDLTPKHKFFFQQQTNVYGVDKFELKNHLVYGVGNGLEIGVNVVNLKMDFRTSTELLKAGTDSRIQPMSPLFQLTGQKFFFLNKKLKTSIGTQLGTDPTRLRTDGRLTHFTYNTWVYEPRQHVKIVAGPYLSDQGTVGGSNNAGLLLGFEYPVSSRLLIMGDFISGTNATSVSVVGINFLATKRVQLCLGALLPNPNSQNKAGLVFELNLLGFDDGSDH
jgi:hypothetical protein